MLDLKSKSQFLSAKFSFYIMQTYSKNPMKNSKRRKETHSHRNPQKATAWYFNILAKTSLPIIWCSLVSTLQEKT